MNMINGDVEIVGHLRIHEIIDLSLYCTRQSSFLLNLLS